MSDEKPIWVNAADVPEHMGNTYPAPLAEAVAGRAKRRLGDAVGLNQFDVNLVTFAPGIWSSQPHGHQNEDECVYILGGEPILATDAGQTVLRPRMAAGFPAGRRDGHRLINNTDAPVVYLEVGTRAPSKNAEYSDIDMKVRRDGQTFVYAHKNGEPYA